MHRSISGLAIALVAAVASGQDRPRPASESALIVRTYRGLERLSMRDADAKNSEAALDPTCLADKGGRVPDAPGGYTLHAQVIVAADSLRGLGQLAGRAVAVVGAPGYWSISAPSVRAAARLADRLAGAPAVKDAYVEMTEPIDLRALPTDPDVWRQWHLSNFIFPQADANLEPAWDMGYTGAGVTIGIVEPSQWQLDHPDLGPNLVAQATMPGGIPGWHATGCAGVAAAAGYNGMGGAGAAYDAGLSSQLIGSDTQTAAAFAFANDIVSVKSNSWGPSDNGWLHTMTPLQRDSLTTAATTGRGGLGSVFVWAAGNGGTTDRVDYDPFASSRYVIPVGAIGDFDTRASYNELGSSHFIVAPSSGNARDIYTTDLDGGYRSNFGGTSSAAPLVAGVVALMLQANPALTWRDVQHILADSARMCDEFSATWTTNAAGRNISYDYGLGAIDAGAAVTIALAWTPIAPEALHDTGTIAVNAALPDNNPSPTLVQIDVPEDIQCESVELVLNVQTTFVGDLRIDLVSPGGTHSVLSVPRSDPQDNLVDYIFTTRRCWGESAQGTWTVAMSDERAGAVATWVDARLRVYGVGAPCPADFNADALLNGLDVGLFLVAYSDGDLSADLSGDGTLDADDVQLFLTAYTQGCD